MNVLTELRRRFAGVLTRWVKDPRELAEMVRPSQDPRHGDYQANCAMPLGKIVGKPPREVAAEIVTALKLDDLCETPEVAGPGFINLRLKSEWLAAAASAALADPRLGMLATGSPGAPPRRTIVIDYSAPNVAKPMHVGHIRSTVIGDALARILRFAGHQVITDNHLGDWGTQFGMILYGYKHFRDEAAYQTNPVLELARLYKLVNQLVEYHEAERQVPQLEERIGKLQSQLSAAQSAPAGDKVEQKKAQQTAKRLEKQIAESQEELREKGAKLAAVDDDPQLAAALAAHPQIARDVLLETSKLHFGDAENLALWKEFLPPCLEDIARIYRRLGVSFDHTLGESFYHDRLPGVVEDLKQRGLARVSDGAVCVFLDGFDTPMIIQKQDGAYLYATTDLATIQYRETIWNPDAILYVVDHRQSLHFEQLFATTRLWGYRDVELAHIKFGTVLGEDGRPFKTRGGKTVSLDSLLDEGVRKAHEVISEKDDAKPGGAELSAEERERIAQVLGIAALKYADLSQNRESDYEFSYEKMLALQGNTATYMQYAYARVRSIFAKGGVGAGTPSDCAAPIQIVAPAERALVLELVRLSEAIGATIADYRPNQLTTYLFDLANRFSTFFDECPVLKAETPEMRGSRLALCDLTARTLKQGLELLGIDVVERM